MILLTCFYTFSSRRKLSSVEGRIAGCRGICDPGEDEGDIYFYQPTGGSSQRLQLPEKVQLIKISKADVFPSSGVVLDGDTENVGFFTTWRGVPLMEVMG